jgi:hypothetical protein
LARCRARRRRPVHQRRGRRRALRRSRQAARRRAGAWRIRARSPTGWARLGQSVPHFEERRPCFAP